MTKIPTKFDSKQEAQAKIDQMVETKRARGGQVYTDSIGGFYAAIELYINGGYVWIGNTAIEV